MKNKKTFGLFALGMIALLGIGLVAAYHGNYSVKGPNYSEARHEAIEQAFDNFDYDAWVALMTENRRHLRIVDVVTEDNFVTFVEAHETGKSGDVERASELRAKLGLNNRMSLRDGAGFGNGKAMKRGLMQGSGMRSQENCLYLE